MLWMRLPKPVLAALIGLVLCLIGVGIQATEAFGVLRERAFDQLLSNGLAVRESSSVRVVDIDRASLDRMGPWPWSRDRFAVLVGAIAAARPKVIGVDILLVGSDERSPGSLARQLAEVAPDQRVAELAARLADELPDADKTLARIMGAAPVVLGLVLDSERLAEIPPSVAMLVRGRPDLGRIWREESAAGPIGVLARTAAGLGVLLLPGDADARIRRLPLFVATAAGLRPGLALELSRVAAESSSYLLSAAPAAIQAGPTRIGVGPDGMLRLRPVPGALYAAQTLSAHKVLEDASLARSLAGKIVLLGSSAPELGGLRPSPAGNLVPSVQLQADGVRQILTGDAPLRPDWLANAELLVALGLAIVVAFAGFAMSPWRAGILSTVIVVIWLAASLISVRRFGLLLDPVLVPAIAVAGFGIATLIAATETRWREAFIRRRFEQHLAPAVVQRIVEQPGLLRLEGESRVITALFTDIEGFTSLTERAGPVDLVALLDRYIEGTSRIVLEHGGMVEKIVGDALHAIFNAPLDLPNHPLCAYRCALALQEFSERMREEPDARRLAFGRTRIGFETGRVIVGDVGGGRRLDYTAHGNAMNTAARLEAANKELGSAICIGPSAAEHLPAEELRSLGAITLRGLSEPRDVYEPWPPAMTGEDRVAYRAAMQLAKADPAAGRTAFTVLAARFPNDGVLRQLSQKSV